MGVLWMKIISIACINVVLINNNDYNSSLKIRQA